MRSLVTTAALAAAALFAAAPAQAQTTPDFTHQGLYLRVEGGLGYLHSEADFASTSATAYGGAGYLGFALGGAIAPDVVLYGEIWGMGAVNPTYQFAGATGTLDNQTLNYSGLGLGIGFFTAGNVFVGISLDATRLGITDNDNGDQSRSDVGGAVTLTIGKQWWISPHWGLGFSVKGIGGGNHQDNDNNDSATYKTFTGLGTITLTYG